MSILIIDSENMIKLIGLIIKKYHPNIYILHLSLYLFHNYNKIKNLTEKNFFEIAVSCVKLSIFYHMEYDGKMIIKNNKNYYYEKESFYHLIDGISKKYKIINLNEKSHRIRMIKILKSVDYKLEIKYPKSIQNSKYYEKEIYDLKF